MALIVRRARPNYDGSQLLTSPQVTGSLYAAEDLPAACPCYIDTDLKAHKSSGAANDKKARVDGLTFTDHKAGEAITLHGVGNRIRYSDGLLTPGADIYLSATAGELEDAPTPGSPLPLARAINTNELRIVRNY